MSSSSTPSPDVQNSSGRGRQGLLIVILIGLCLLFVAGYVQRLAEKEAATAQIALMAQQIEQAKVRNAVLASELAQVNDDEHVAAIARDALNLVQEGDQLVALIDAPPAAEGPASPPNGVRQPVNSEPNWQRWLDLIFPFP